MSVVACSGMNPAMSLTGMRDALYEENEVLSAVHLVPGRSVIRVHTRHPVVTDQA